MVTWRRHTGRWYALIVDAIGGTELPEVVVVQRWVPAEHLRPVPADPNRSHGVR